MHTFGVLKTKLEEASVKLYGKKEFNNFMIGFKKYVLENKDVSEIYHIYDDLSTSKGLDKDISNDYLNESLEYAQILIENNLTRLSNINTWVSRIVKESKNNYKDIDNVIYNNTISNLESILESKRNIKNTIVSESVIKRENTKTMNIPLNSIYNIANKTISKHLENVNENEKNELKSILSLTSNEIEKEMDGLKENVISKLKLTLNESTDVDYTTKVQSTINKVMESKNDHYNLYKLRNLNEGL
jgi:hypothetical protein